MRDSQINRGATVRYRRRVHQPSIFYTMIVMRGYGETHMTNVFITMTRTPNTMGIIDGDMIYPVETLQL